jgi:hypothetical protein
MLDQAEMAWRPGTGCNPIGLILYHSMRFEDSVIQTRFQGQKTVWESEKWYEKMKLPESESGARFTEEQVAAFPVPEPSDLMAYLDAVRAHTIEYIKSQTPEAFDKVINYAAFSRYFVVLLALLIGHQSQHVGEISIFAVCKRNEK